MFGCLQHPGSHVVAHGKRQTTRGEVTRFKCTPHIDSPHTFTVLEPSTRRLVAAWSPPPTCPLHDDSKVVRNGIYGKRTQKPRQRYRCYPADGSKPHNFTPPLPRDHVHENAEHCAHCNELRGVHRGETAVARRHTWSTRVVARGLEQLAAGATYADVSRWAIRVTDSARTRRSQGRTSKKKVSPTTRQSRNSWHIAAGWTEVFAPVIFEHLDTQLRQDALADRARIDATADGHHIDRPQVLLIDDVPVLGRELGPKSRARRDVGYFVLVAAETKWPAPDDDPFVTPADPELRLRLIRVMAKSNTSAWRLLFSELGYAPDFIVAGTGIASAIRTHFDPTKTRWIPSLWHVAQKVEDALADIPAARVASAVGVSLIPPLAEHVRKLSRNSGVLHSGDSWSEWWDRLLELCVEYNLATDQLRTRRRTYEPAMAKVIDAIAANPGIPVSTGGLETLIAKHVKPMLAMRRSSFGNLERTNNLFDLVVAKHHHVFDDLAGVAARLRADNEPHGGWTTALRTVDDPRPARGYYSSLRDTTLLDNIARKRGLL